MAKIDCTLAITSDIVDGLAVNQTMTLNKADSTVGLELTTGLAKRSFTSTNQVDLLTASGSGTETTIDSSGTAYYRIGRLYGGDWMLIPWDAASTTGDITIQPSSATKMDVEYMVFYE